MKQADRLRELIKASGLSQAEVARQAGVSYSRLNNYLSGARNPDPATLDRIASVVGSDLEELNGASESLSIRMAAILGTVLRLNGIGEEKAVVIASVAVEALRALRSLPEDGDVALRARLAAQIAWQSHNAARPKQ